MAITIILTIFILVGIKMLKDNPRTYSRFDKRMEDKKAQMELEEEINAAKNKQRVLIPIKREVEIMPFYGKRPLSKIEQVLYFRLLEALPDHVILAQVQLSRFLGVKKGFNVMEWNNRINRMSADYVICRKDFSIIAIIELDDASHNSESRIANDLKKDQAIKDSGLKIIRWHVNNMPDIEKIQSTIKQENN